MDAQHNKVLKSISLELHHLLAGSYDNSGRWHPGDLEQRLAGIGVRRDRQPVGVDELSHLPPADQKARQVVDAYLPLRAVERNSFRSRTTASSGDPERNEFRSTPGSAGTGCGCYNIDGAASVGSIGSPRARRTRFPRRRRCLKSR